MLLLRRHGRRIQQNNTDLDSAEKGKKLNYEPKDTVNVLKILNTLAGIHKKLVKIANREVPEKTIISSDAV